MRTDKMEEQWREDSRKMDQRIMEANKRMDGVYHILLKRIENQSNN